MSANEETTALIAELNSWTVDDAPNSVVGLMHRAADRLTEESDARASLIDTVTAAGTRQRLAVDWWIEQHMIVGEIESVRDGWWQAECACGWRTNGAENIVEDAAFEHALECMKPADRLTDLITPKEQGWSTADRREAE